MDLTLNRIRKLAGLPTVDEEATKEKLTERKHPGLLKKLNEWPFRRKPRVGPGIGYENLDDPEADEEMFNRKIAELDPARVARARAERKKNIVGLDRVGESEEADEEMVDEDCEADDDKDVVEEADEEADEDVKETVEVTLEDVMKLCPQLVEAINQAEKKLLRAVKIGERFMSTDSLAKSLEEAASKETKKPKKTKEEVRKAKK